MRTRHSHEPAELPPTGPLQAFLELTALCAFVVAQPVLDVLARGSELLVFGHPGRSEILITVVAVTLLPPLALFTVELAVRTLSGPRAGSTVHRAVIAALAGLYALQLLQARTWFPRLAVVCLSAATAVLAARAYARWDGVRLWMRLASPAPIVFAAVFLFTSPVPDLLAPPGRAVAGAPNGSGAPVVLMILDELPLASLLGEYGTIDRRLYPNIAAFGEQASFFRNATGAAARTVHAIPAMLTGRFPMEQRAPVSAQYPGNLFALLAGSHELHVFESVTALCPRDACPDNEWGVRPRRDMLRDAAYMWARTLAPGRPGGDKVRSWFGIDGVESARGSRPPDDAAFLLERIQDDQAQRFDRFLATIDGKGTPFHFIHLVLPHAPWHYLPDGTEYYDRGLGMVDYEQRTSQPWPALVNRQRHVLQAMWVDRLVGEALHRLQQVGLYDRATVLLTADHGMSFTPAPPGVTRALVPENEHEVGWVPFLVKVPGQASGDVRDDNVMGVDVAPTVAALAGARIPWEVDGISVLDERRESAAKLFFNEPGRAVPLDPGGLSKALEAAASHIFDLDRGEGRPYVLRQFAELAGLDLARAVEPGTTGVVATVDDLAGYQRVGAAPGKVPSLLTGHVVPGERTTPPDTVVAVVNGAVAGASPLYPEGDQPHRFALMIDPALLRPGPNSVKLFSLEGRAGTPRLRGMATVGA